MAYPYSNLFGNIFILPYTEDEDADPPPPPPPGSGIPSWILFTRTDFDEVWNTDFSAYPGSTNGWSPFGDGWVGEELLNIYNDPSPSSPVSIVPFMSEIKNGVSCNQYFFTATGDAAIMLDNSYALDRISFYALLSEEITLEDCEGAITIRPLQEYRFSFSASAWSGMADSGGVLSDGSKSTYHLDGSAVPPFTNRARVYAAGYLGASSKISEISVDVAFLYGGALTTGAQSPTVLFQYSTDGNTWVDIITVNAARNQEPFSTGKVETVTSGLINVTGAYVRAVCTNQTSGTFTVFTYLANLYAMAGDVYPDPTNSISGEITVSCSTDLINWTEIYNLDVENEDFAEAPDINSENDDIVHRSFGKIIDIDVSDVPVIRYLRINGVITRQVYGKNIAANYISYIGSPAFISSPLCTPPDAPEIELEECIGPAVRISWESVPGALGYYVFVNGRYLSYDQYDQLKQQIKFAGHLPASATNFTLHQAPGEFTYMKPYRVSPDYEYMIQIAAFNGCGVSPLSNAVVGSPGGGGVRNCGRALGVATETNVKDFNCE